MITKITKTITLMHTTVAPIGVERMMDAMIPDTAQKTPTTPEAITTDRKLLNILSVDKTGNTISADIRSEPTSCMLKTITTAIIIDKRIL